MKRRAQAPKVQPSAATVARRARMAAGTAPPPPTHEKAENETDPKNNTPCTTLTVPATETNEDRLMTRNKNTNDATQKEESQDNLTESKTRAPEPTTATPKKPSTNTTPETAPHLEGRNENQEDEEHSPARKKSKKYPSTNLPGKRAPTTEENLPTPRHPRRHTIEPRIPLTLPAGNRGKTHISEWKSRFIAIRQKVCCPKCSIPDALTLQGPSRCGAIRAQCRDCTAFCGGPVMRLAIQLAEAKNENNDDVNSKRNTPNQAIKIPTAERANMEALANAENLDMTESQAFCVLPSFLDSPAKYHYSAAVALSGSGSGVWNWPSAVNWLLRTYASDELLNQALNALRRATQKSNEDEGVFLQRINLLHARCGYPLPAAEFMALFVDGLDNRNRPLLHRYRTQNRNADLIDIVEVARAEGQTMRNSLHSQLSTSNRNEATQRRPAATNLVNYVDNDGDHIFLTNDTDEHAADDTLREISGSTTAYELALALERTPFDRIVPNNPPMKGAGPRTGWKDRVRTFRGVICHQCYAVGKHYKPDCKTDPRQNPEVVVDNFERLNLAMKIRVPWESYLQVTGFLTVDRMGISGFIKVILSTETDDSKDSPASDGSIHNPGPGKV